MFVEEIKGYVFQRMKFGLKNIAAYAYCQIRGQSYRIIYEKDLDTVR